MNRYHSPLYFNSSIAFKGRMATLAFWIVPFGFLLPGCTFPAAVAQERTPAPRVLFFSRNVGYEHAVVHREGSQLSLAERRMTQMLGKLGAAAVCKKDGRIFDQDLAVYDAFVFYTNGDLTLKNRRHVPPMTARGLQRLLAAIDSGTGFFGIHSTCASWRTAGEKNENHPERLSPFLKMLGGEFIAHGAQQEATLRLVDPHFPGVQKLDGALRMYEEYYGLKNFATDLHVILVQETAGMQGNWYQRPPYPATWARKQKAGRVFFTSLGHRADVWSSQPFEQIVLGGLSWVLGKVDADVTANITSATPEASTLSGE